MRRIVEDTLPHSEILDPVSIEGDGLYQRVQRIHHDPDLQRSCVPFIIDMYPQVPPFGRISITSRAEQNPQPWRSSFSLPGSLEEPEIVKIMLLFEPAPPAYYSEIIALREQTALNPDPQFDSFRNDYRDFQQHFKGNDARPLFAARLQASGLLRKEKLMWLQREILSMCNVYRFGNKPFRVATLRDYKKTGCSDQTILMAPHIKT